MSGEETAMVTRSGWRPKAPTSSRSIFAARLTPCHTRWRRPEDLTASVAALAAAKIGHDARAVLGRRLPDPVVAVAEDALAIGLAAVGSG